LEYRVVKLPRPVPWIGFCDNEVFVVDPEHVDDFKGYYPGAVQVDEFTRCKNNGNVEVGA